MVGVAEGDGAAVGASGGVFSLAESVEKPRDLFLIQRLLSFSRKRASGSRQQALERSVGPLTVIASSCSAGTEILCRTR